GGMMGGWGGWDDGSASATSGEMLLPLEQNPYDQILYYVTTRDFLSISETKVFFDPYYSVIDASFIRKGESYYMFMKNEDADAKNIMIAPSPRMNRFSIDELTVITGDYWAEGPSPLQVGEFVYVYFDKYTEKKYGAVRSSDMTHWDDVSDQVSFPEGIRHGTAFTVKESVLKKLLSAK
ncbi:MAG: hypothetical protein IJS25_01920, partial [Bacteroidales bacterium]|nr:hypothetical protein [Bacteroidales bacterium]